MRLFWRIFLSFWIATGLMIAAVLGVGEIWPWAFPGDSNAGFYPQVSQAILTKAAEAYEREGEPGFLAYAHIRHHTLYLFDSDAQLLVKQGTSTHVYQRMVADALESQHIEVRRLGLRAIFAYPITTASGRRYCVVFTVTEALNRLMKPRLWFNLAVAMLPAALVCALLTLYITRPVTRLRATAQRLADGDLSARSSPHRIARKDELGDLARDFDVMAARIQLLMTAQRRFVADVSHELGAPLTRMHLALALLRRQFVRRDTAELARIERETDKLSNLVQQLLLLATLEAGSLPAETLAPISMLALCDSLIEDAGFEATHSGCTIGGTREEIVLLAYPQLLRRAIDNILRNAIRYTPPDSEILLNCRTEEQHQVVIEIMDCGPGVPESMLADIFRPFFRTDSGRDRGVGGTGLGLTIAREAVRLHDGEIRARNRIDGGLQVTITFPLRTPDPNEDSQATTARDLLPQ